MRYQRTGSHWWHDRFSPRMDNGPNHSVVETPITFPALDGFDLGGVIYAPMDAVPPTLAVVVNCGGGVPAFRYSNFARFLGKAGIPTLVYDYRGIGGSRPIQLRGFSATVEDWSEYDCAGAIALVHKQYPTSALVGVAHSIGAYLMGAAPNIDMLSRMVFVGAHTAYFGDYRPLLRWPMALLWHGVMPVLTHAFGYFPGRRLRLGDDIPREIALQWAARRTADPKAKVYSGRDPTRSIAFFHRCASATGNALMLGFTDDAFATSAGTRRFRREFPRIDAMQVELAPGQVGLKRIGHFGFLSRIAEAALWPIALAYIRDGVPPRPPMVENRADKARSGRPFRTKRTGIRR